MNLVEIPFHDWRKIRQEGFRTRDAHFIEQFIKKKDVENLIIINRPLTLAEIFVTKKEHKIPGEILLKKGGLKLIKVQPNVYVIDYLSSQNIQQILKKKSWFIDSFGHSKLQEFTLEALKLLNINDFSVISHNIYASRFCQNLESHYTSFTFDGYDNLLLFPDHQRYHDDLRKAYHIYLKLSKSHWTTNSWNTQQFFLKEFGKDNVPIIPNGVDIERFAQEYPMPEDLGKLPAPIIGFGGKITSLFDAELFNHVLKACPDKHFVIIGQVLDKEKFNAIEKTPNFHYLGDKHYSEYPAYVRNFDLTIIPYRTEKTWGDTIKVYEFLAAGKNVIGTKGNGLIELEKFVYLADNKEEFAKLVDEAVSFTKLKEDNLPDEFTWNYKADQLIEILSS